MDVDGGFHKKTVEEDLKMKLKEQMISQVVIGSGAAGFQSALRLYQNEGNAPWQW